MEQDELKKQVALAVLEYIEDDAVIGVGTGSTVNFFIDRLVSAKQRIEGAVASSERTAALLKKHDIPVISLNSAGTLPVYIDGADEATRHRYLIKGGGGALAREKILAAASRRFICIIDSSKLADTLGGFPLAIEVLPMARSYVARELIKLGGRPVLREGYTTDNGNIILDVHGLDLLDPPVMEQKLNGLAGVVANGLFACRYADLLLIAGDKGVQRLP